MDFCIYLSLEHNYEDSYMYIEHDLSMHATVCVGGGEGGEAGGAVADHWAASWIQGVS